MLLLRCTLSYKWIKFFGKVPVNPMACDWRVYLAIDLLSCWIFKKSFRDSTCCLWCFIAVALYMVACFFDSGAWQVSYTLIKLSGGVRRGEVYICCFGWFVAVFKRIGHFARCSFWLFHAIVWGDYGLLFRVALEWSLRMRWLPSGQYGLWGLYGVSSLPTRGCRWRPPLGTAIQASI